MSRETIIKISRSKYTEESLEVALIRLDTIFHYKGVLKMINYYTDSSQSSIDTVFAPGAWLWSGASHYWVNHFKTTAYGVLPIFAL